MSGRSPPLYCTLDLHQSPWRDTREKANRKQCSQNCFIGIYMTFLLPFVKWVLTAPDWPGTVQKRRHLYDTKKQVNRLIDMAGMNTVVLPENTILVSTIRHRRPLLTISPYLPNVRRVHSHVSYFSRKFWASKVIFRGSAAGVFGGFV